MSSNLVSENSSGSMAKSRQTEEAQEILAASAYADKKMSQPGLENEF